MKQFLKSFVNHLGFDIRRIPRFESIGKDTEHQLVKPNATYSPWNKDKIFQEAYGAIEQFTLVDKYRCFELWKLIEQSAKLEIGSIIEVGVWRGGTGALIAKQSKLLGLPCQVYLCDTFSGIVKAGVEDSAYKGGEHADTSRQAVEDLIYGKMGLDNVRILKGVFPEETGHEVEKENFRFVHIDVDVYQSAKDIIDWIWHRMPKGGIVVYDDYGFQTCGGITKYVEEQMSLKDRIVLHNLNGHAIVLKL